MINKTMARRLCLMNLVSLFFTAGTCAAVTDIFVTRDASIYSEVTEQSNGAGQYLFAGVTGVNNSEQIRRSMLYFDIVSALPVGAVVTSATLRLNVDREPFGAGSTVMSLHAAESGWGEGTTDPTGTEASGTTAQIGDATWSSSFYQISTWTTPGGDFNAVASDTETVSGLGLIFFSSPTMASDVQSWYDIPSQNFGWFLIGDETDTRNARRFTSGEDLDLESIIPMLSIGYTVVPEPGVLPLFIIGSVLFLNRSRLSFVMKCGGETPI